MNCIVKDSVNENVKQFQADRLVRAAWPASGFPMRWFDINYTDSFRVALNTPELLNRYPTYSSYRVVYAQHC